MSTLCVGAASEVRIKNRSTYGRRELQVHFLGAGQIVSWGSLFYSYPLIAEAMAKELGFAKAQVYGAATIGFLLSSVAAYPIGTAIDRGWGRLIMAGGSVLGAVLLFACAGIHNLWMLYLLIGLLGIAQSMTLYEAVFAVVARNFSSNAVAKITAVTLWGGFASTLFVPLTQMFLSYFDWRNTFLVLGIFNLLIGFIYWRIIERRKELKASEKKYPFGSHSAVLQAMKEPIFWGLLVSFTVYYGTFSGITYHLYPILLEKKMSAGVVVLLISLIGPSQVLARVIASYFGKYKSMMSIGKIIVPAFPVALFAYLMLPGAFGAIVFILIYGMANGVMTIIRGTAVPEMLGSKAYGAINGAVAFPATIAKAAAPFLIAFFWSISKSYDSVVFGILISSLLVVAGFWYATIQSERRRELNNNFS